MDDMFRLAWKQYRTWAVTARHLKERNEAWKRRVLVMTLLGVVFSTMAPFASAMTASPLPARIAGAIGAVCLAVATYFGKELLSATHEERWTRARTAAEALKSEACKYAAQAPPYDGADRILKLRARLTDLDALTKGQLADNIDQAEAVKGLPDAWWTASDYIAKRLQDQIDWYRARAAQHATSMARGRTFALTLGVIAVVLSAVTGVAGQDGTFPAALLGVVTTAGGSIGAYFQAGHYETLALKYRETADALDRRRVEFTSGAVSDVQQLIVDAETIMQAENAAWLVELTAKTA